MNSAAVQYCQNKHSAVATNLTMRRLPRRAFLAGAGMAAGRQEAALVLPREAPTGGSPVVAVVAAKDNDEAPPQCPPQLGDKKPLTTAAVAAIDSALSRVLLAIVAVYIPILHTADFKRGTERRSRWGAQ